MIYLVRHGESAANTEGKYQGQTYDTHLSALGKRQVQLIANYFKDKKIDEIWVSPLTRTKETAQAISIAVSLPYRLEPLLLETDHGEWAGKEKKWVKRHYPEFSKIWQERPGEADFPGGERFADVVERARKVLERHPDGEKNVIMVSHDNTIRAILSVAERRDINKMWDYPMENASIAVLSKKGDFYDLEEIIISHLGQLRSDVAEQVL